MGQLSNQPGNNLFITYGDKDILLVDIFLFCQSENKAIIRPCQSFLFKEYGVIGHFGILVG